MGGGTFDSARYANFSASTASMKREEIYTSRHTHKDLDPKDVKVREARDSAEHPESNAIIIALDVTGSMGMIAEQIARNGLGTLMNGIFDRSPVKDPQIMFAGIGDANYDHAPLQVSQFESDNRIVEQLTKLWLEGGGGGNSFESYNAIWYFAAFHTEIDCMVKRGKRGYLFTVGDEEFPRTLTRDQIKAICGDAVSQELDTTTLLEMAQRKYDVYHVVIKQGNHARSRLDSVRESWKPLGQQVIYLDDYTKLSETIISAIEVAEGRDAHGSAHAWGGDTARVVHEAVKDLPRREPPKMLGGPL